MCIHSADSQFEIMEAHRATPHPLRHSTSNTTEARRIVFDNFRRCAVIVTDSCHSHIFVNVVIARKHV
ncbi:predicted protein [Sclerotinia sclerotiorum 1980 UF-70]|uniref:Uncharacterized protein n=1 Tax=Sclerotinia sclerotiorum (strain ATCC 18683 / 1980 / Ss-1) TaxID=665079 RepID=A7F6W0_SCLS1|nr:predicted protein [Sclerotinia sclerotiorum 1980 UF-70]EDN98481.1 predicted protein [Sclerotinia sclerotiorum 1980 UF-70]